MKSILAVFGLVAIIDYIPDGRFDLTQHAIDETRDAITTLWNAGERKVDHWTRHP